MQSDRPRQHHDMGGQPAGPVDTHEHQNALWEKRVDALMMALRARGHLYVDESRRQIEQLPPDAYDTMGYYERWMHAIRGIVVERGLLTEAEIEAKLAEVRARRETQSGSGG